MKSLQLFLIKRTDGLRDPGRTISSLVTSFTQSLHDWTETQKLPSGRETGVESPWQVYVLGCPQMHPIFADDLLQRIPYLDDREVSVLLILCPTFAPFRCNNTGVRD
jgi:hypothetical protein